MESYPPVTNFGADTSHVRDALIECITDAHLRHVEAQRVSGQAGERVYAQVWNALPDACTSAIRNGWLTSSTVKPGRAGYKLPVLHGTVIFPWRPPAGGTPEETPFLTSPSRSMLFSMPSDAQGMLELDGASPSDESPAPVDEIDAVMNLADRENLSVVVIAAVSSSTMLWRIVWGEVQPGSDGTGLLDFTSFEELYAHDAEQPATERPRSERSFDAGEPPRPLIARRPASSE